MENSLVAPVEEESVEALAFEEFEELVVEVSLVDPHPVNKKRIPKKTTEKEKNLFIKNNRDKKYKYNEVYQKTEENKTTLMKRIVLRKSGMTLFLFRHNSGFSFFPFKARTNRNEFSDDDVLFQSDKIVDFPGHRCIDQNFGGFHE